MIIYSILNLIIFFLFQDSSRTIYPFVESQFGTFSDAVALSVGTSGELFIVEQKPSLIHKYSFDEKKQSSFGGIGWGDYEFDLPVDISSNFLLEVYVVDVNNHRIQQYDRTLNFIQSFSEQKLNDLSGQFYPKAAAISRHGNLFVVESDQNRIIKFSSRQHIEKVFGVNQTGGARLVQPVDITLSLNDDVIVLDKTRIVLYDFYGNYLRFIPLDPTEQWRSISTFNGGLIAVSKKKIKGISIDGKMLFSFDANSIVTDLKQLEFRDAAIIGNQIYILTPTTILRCSLPS